MWKTIIILELVVLAIGLQVQALTEYADQLVNGSPAIEISKSEDSLPTPLLKIPDTLAISEYKDTTEVYAGREEKPSAISYYAASGLPSNREWLTSKEWHGKHVMTKAQKVNFKLWKEKYIQEYIEFWAKAAQKEYKINNVIPPSLIIAQAIIEANYGKSKLAIEGVNYFGHKYRGKDQKAFMVMADDSPTDKFTKYKSKWFSLRAHVKLLQGRYLRRLQGEPTLENWLITLCGSMEADESKKYHKKGNSLYATSCMTEPCYSQKLRNIINLYNLEKFDT